jgi:two-component system sensor histidine kinase/response regulator
MNSIEKRPPAQPPPSPINPEREQARFLSLRAKFSIFTSLLIMLVCSGLSAVLIQQEAAVMEEALINTGTILVKTINKLSTNRVIIQDIDYLETMLDGTMSSPEVVYAIARDQKGRVLVRKSKGILRKGSKGIRDREFQLFPDDTLTTTFFSQQHQTPHTEPLISVWDTVPQKIGKIGSRTNKTSAADMRERVPETLYDFALPVYRAGRRSTTLDLLSSENLDGPVQMPSVEPKIMGVIQVGLTTAYMQKDLDQTVSKTGMYTLAIIAVGIMLTLLMANHIITPLQRLAQAAKRFSEGESYMAVASDALDEVGQLTRSINTMALTLQQREEAISTYVGTITNQLNQLSTLHQTGTMITATLDVQKLFGTVLKLLRENLGFQRMVLVLKDASKNKGIVTEASGIPEELERQIKGFEFSIVPETFDETLLIHGRPVLVPDLDAIVDQMNPDILELGRQVGLVSFVSVPLISHMEVLGYLGADKGQTRCTQEDLDLLMTIASHVAVAIDNARTYQDLETLATGLEQRVRERTQELQSANDRLQELDRLKSAFVSIVSHELRTPMTSIKGLIENMMDGLTGELTEHQTFYLSRVNHNIERLTRMINDLLDLSRIEAGHMELQTTSVDIGSIAKEVVELLNPMAEEKSLTLETNIINPIPVIQGDRDKLIQIFTNLMNNALKFTPPSGTVTVKVKHHADGYIHACVTDTGCGIPLDEQQTVFESFYRSQSADLKNRGAGLGLAITKSLVELHGGTIGVESTLGQGSHFWFNLPLQSSKTPDE